MTAQLASPRLTKIDILLPCFNSSSTILRTVESIRRQSFTAFRVVLIDNNSSDNSVELFEKGGDERFESRRYRDTVSLGENFNRCLDHVESDYFCIMHADDEYQPKYLESMLAAFQKNTDAILAFCNADIIDEVSRKRFSIKNAFKKRPSPSMYTAYRGCEGLAWISEYNKIIAPSVMYRRDAITLIGRFNPELKFTLDWEYYFRALQVGACLLRVNEVLFNYRVHSKQQTALLIASMTKYHEMYALLGAIYRNLEAKCDGATGRKYKYFCYAIVADLLTDLVHGKFPSASHKLRFLSKLVGKEQPWGEISK